MLTTQLILLQHTHSQSQYINNATKANATLFLDIFFYSLKPFVQSDFSDSMVYIFTIIIHSVSKSVWSPNEKLASSIHLHSSVYLLFYYSYLIIFDMKSSTVRVVQQHLCQCMEYRICYVCDGSHAVHLIQRIIKAFVLL